ncbi:hypothetical protein [Clostridium sp. Marseille-P299]|uniref:hypothetical protein n=1 Tax=Clostridium sp. Marseille-P299 TaxID=1805477 RepID=UPI00082FE73B|nr:hypothetical protein [Clostridium sp. Marseille-P299]
MIDKSSIIFTKVKYAVASLCSSASTTYQDTPPNFPHLFFNQLDNPSTAEDMDNNENAVIPMIEITTYTKGDSSFNDGKKIHNLSDASMRSMGFKRTFGPQQVTNISDKTICRIIARYTRVIGNSDTF